tara:strand:+ start:3192 stop:3800 length:609 start_codon:yes stop_codon:yes gene_type:complete
MTHEQTVNVLRGNLRAVLAPQRDRLQRAKRAVLHGLGAAESGRVEELFEIRERIASEFDTQFHNVLFCGSAHYGFSPTKGTLFDPMRSDLDVAIIDLELYRKAAEEAFRVTRGFNDLTPFTHRGGQEASEMLSRQMSKRAMILMSIMPESPWVRQRDVAMSKLSNQYSNKYRSISVAIYMSDYFFCWKQDSAIETIMRGSDA